MSRPASDPDGLRRLAEARLRKSPKAKKPADPRSKGTPRRMLHELQVHQVELEMQNTELEEARGRTEVLLEKYTDLYDFAPVGFFTLAADSKILQVNLTGSRLVGMERSLLQGRVLAKHVAADLQPAFREFLRRVFASEDKQSCELVLLRAGQPPRPVNIEARRSSNLRECHAAVMDITDRKRAERVRQRLELLTASNAKFKQEIVHRKMVAQTLQKTKQQQARMLEQSRQQQEQLRELSHQVLNAQIPIETGGTGKKAPRRASPSAAVAG